MLVSTGNLRLSHQVNPKPCCLERPSAHDGSVEVSIFIEVFESALTVKSELNRTVEVKQIAQMALEFCEKYSADSELLRTAQRLAK
jgi:hypothetical protein